MRDLPDAGTRTLGQSPPTLLFDGSCGFCHRCSKFARARLPLDASVIAYQRADLERLGVTTEQASNAAYWIDDTERLAGHDAIARVLREFGGAWRCVGIVMSWRPIAAIGHPVYRYVAKRRGRLPGSTGSCDIPIDE